jgi:FkbM family methyltransferase
MYAVMRFLRDNISQKMPNNPVLAGWASYSQCDEDGIIRECLRRISNSIKLSKKFVEIGCADGLENNTCQLIVDGFYGIWIDGAKEKIKFISDLLGGTIFPRLWVIEAMVNQESAYSLALRSSRFLDVDSIDFLSIDIDGNDYHICAAFLTKLNPKLVCVEYDAKFPSSTRLIIDYNKEHTWQGDDYCGASLQAWCDLLDKHGYIPVCCNLSGVKAFFVRQDLIQSFTQYPLDILYQPARYFLVDMPKGHKASASWVRQLVNSDKCDTVPFIVVNTTTATGIIGSEFVVHSKPDMYISGDIMHHGVWEPFESEIFSHLCQPGDVVLDLGANIGWYTVLAAKRVGNFGRVIAFEPDSENLRLLKVNAALADQNGNVEIVNSAVGDQNGKAVLYKSETNLGDHRLFPDDSIRRKTTVPIITLDLFFSNVDNTLPTLLKIDTQGCEAKILKGAKGLFSRSWRPIMFLEFWPYGLEQAGCDPINFWQDIVQLGYEIFEISGCRSQLVPIHLDDLQKHLKDSSFIDSRSFINLLCMPNLSARFDFIADLINSSAKESVAIVPGLD